MALPKTFTGGERLFADDLNDNFSYLDAKPSYEVGFRTSTSSTETLDFSTGDEIVRSTRGGTLTLAGNNYTAGVSKTVIWNGGSSNRSVSFPSQWVFVSFKPTSLPANKRGVLALTCHGNSASDVTAAWAVQA